MWNNRKRPYKTLDQVKLRKSIKMWILVIYAK